MCRLKPYITQVRFICVYIDRLDIFCKYLQIFDLLVLKTNLFLEFCLPTFVIFQIHTFHSVQMMQVVQKRWTYNKGAFFDYVDKTREVG